MSIAATCIDSGSPLPANSTLPSRVAASAAPSTGNAQSPVEVVEIHALPTASTSLSRTAIVGWTSSTVTHIAVAAVAIAWAVYSPELPTLGGSANDRSVPLTVAVSERESTEPQSFEAEATPTKTTTSVEPHVEPVDHRDPSDFVDDTHRRFVVEEAPAVASPPNMARDDAQLAEETTKTHAANPTQTTKTRKVRVKLPAIVAIAARPPAFRITRNAEPYKNPDPVHPPEALAHGLSGTVVLRLHIDAHGKVRNADIHQSSGHSVLDEAAASHVLEHWTFRPAHAGRRAVEQVRRVRINFH